MKTIPPLFLLLLFFVCPTFGQSGSLDDGSLKYAVAFLRRLEIAIDKNVIEKILTSDFEFIGSDQTYNRDSLTAMLNAREPGTQFQYSLESSNFLYGQQQIRLSARLIGFFAEPIIATFYLRWSHLIYRAFRGHVTSSS